MGRNAEVELIEYRIGDIGHTTGKLIYNFAQYSGIAGTREWPKVNYAILMSIRDQTPLVCLWETAGIDVHFSCFLNPKPIIKGNGISFESPAPRFVFIERPELMTPSLRTHVARVTDAIAQEMQDVYYLHIEKDPLTLIFPKEKYAKRIDRFTVPLLQ